MHPSASQRFTHKPTTLKKQPSMPRTKLPASPWMPAGEEVGKHLCWLVSGQAQSGLVQHAAQQHAKRNCNPCHDAQPKQPHRSCRPCQTAPQRRHMPQWRRGSAHQTPRWWSPQSCGAAGRHLWGAQRAGQGEPHQHARQQQPPIAQAKLPRQQWMLPLVHPPDTLCGMTSATPVCT